MSQQQLALKLNLSQQTIYKYENQITEPDINLEFPQTALKR